MRNLEQGSSLLPYYLSYAWHSLLHRIGLARFFAVAQQAEIPPEVEEYSLALQAFREASAKQPVEPVFALGLAAADSLKEILELLDDAAYELASK